ncbi:hypothetical protein J7E96_28235 [Streptomyces sp. ISL-96]|uniref:hypothetical protein n=1 Tax=Streptomyces sp. ISL-96 TaxID=2819191 RepID=UPI001BE58BA1|nr:hypothetical protein [Streptomyces sp. ISL-96]MBT2492329.1 hypothetical protein [Streptomyces sp. ISL-96]
MDALDLLVLVDVFIAVASTGHVWGPALLGLAVVAAWWRLRPTGRLRGGGDSLRTTVRTSVRAVVRRLADTGPDPAASDALSCADTCPDTSADTCPAVPGHDEEGEC